MVKGIYYGVKDVCVELSSGMKEACDDINCVLDGINVKLMGTYEEIEAYEKAKAEALEAQEKAELELETSK